MQAIWNNRIIAESDDTIVVEGNPYFPFESINHEFLDKSETTSQCPWKGKATYYSLVVEGEVNPDAAFCYPQPKQAAQSIQGRVAFGSGVQLVDSVSPAIYAQRPAGSRPWL